MMNDRVYNKEIERLRSEERKNRLEIERTVDLCLQNNNINSILDVGTGSGLFAEEFYKRGIQTTGIDLNPEMIDAAKSFLPNCDFHIGVAEALPFDDNSFDMVFMGLVFHEVSDYMKAISESFRVSNKLLAILEWKYKEEESGPPLEHRLEKNFVKELSGKAGFTKFSFVELNNLILYLLYK